MSKDEIKVALAQEKIKNLEINVEKIMTNHLPHLQAAIDRGAEKMDKLELQIARWTGGVAVALAIFQVILKFL